MRTIVTIFKLMLVALLANATWHAFGAYSPHLKFKDGVEYAAKYRGALSDDDLRDKILSIASQFDVPLVEANLSVTTPGFRHTIIDLSYVRPVSLAPVFIYQWPLSLHVDAYTVPLPSTEDLRVPK